MLREVEYNGQIIEYNLTRKRVKNINLRIKPDCTVEVSANSRVSMKYIDSFVVKKGGFIVKALDEFKSRKDKPKVPNFSDEEFKAYAEERFLEIYNLFLDYNIKKPSLKIRTMKTRWGSCNYVKSVITLNTNLKFCTEEQIDYVIIHEFSHLIVPNHSKDFYDIVSRFCLDYKRIRKEMKEI